MSIELKAISDILFSQREMLKEYFSMCINDNSELETIPLLLKGYTPNLDKLPLFLMRLGPEVCHSHIWADNSMDFALFR